MVMEIIWGGRNKYISMLLQVSWKNAKLLRENAKVLKKIFFPAHIFSSTVSPKVLSNL